MAKENIQVSFGIQGMERSGFEHQLDEKMFTFQRNGNLESDEESLGLTNEHSNLLCSKFKPGYVVIGKKYDGNNNRILFILTERYPDENGKRKSEIGQIKFNTTINVIDDTIVDCGCDYNTILSDPLENITQIPHCIYETIIADDCNNCLNLDPNHPIHTIVLKEEACGFTMTFASDNNPLRYIILDKLDPYYYTGDINCGEDNREPTCLDCEKLRVFPLYNKPYLFPEKIQYGGRLKRGTYEFLIAYCDKLGQELSPYLSITQPIDVFDINNIRLTQSTQYDETNYGIRLKVSNLDKRFNFYKIAVIQKTDVTGASSSFIEGIHVITDNDVLYTSDSDKERVSIQHLFLEKPVYKNVGGILASNKYLFAYNYSVEKEWNLQPIANILGSLVEWQTVEADEDLYKDGIANSLYGGYMRDEVYPLGIRFRTNTSYVTSVFPLIGRPSTSYERENILNLGYNDVNSIVNSLSECQDNYRKERWQFYNTAKEDGYCFDNSVVTGTPQIRTVVETCSKEVNTLENGTITIQLEDEFLGLGDWINTNYDETNCTLPVELCGALNINNYTDEICPINWTDGNNIFPFPISDMGGNGTCSLPEITNSKIYVDQIIGENIKLEEKRYPWENDSRPSYEHTFSTQQCVLNNVSENVTYKKIPIYKKDNTDDEYLEQDIELKNIKDRFGSLDNTSCVTSQGLDSTAQFFSVDFTGNMATTIVNSWLSINIWDPFLGPNVTHISYTNFKHKDDYETFPDLGSLISKSKNSLLTSIDAPSYPGFENKIPKNALWYNISFDTNDKLLIEITPEKEGKCLKDDVLGDKQVRYVIYNKCNNGTILQHGTYDSSQGLFLLLNKSDFNTNTILLSLDTKILSLEKYYKKKLEGNNILHIKYDIFANSATCGCFDVKIRKPEYYQATVSYDKIIFNKEIEYTSSCIFVIPNSSCTPSSYKYGTFSFWESSEEYPNNSELYDSSGIKIKVSTLDKLRKNDVKSFNKFKEYYIDDIDSNDNYTWKTENGRPLVNFTCEKIRHFKFPDNRVAPFMDTIPLTEFSKNRIYPLGIKIDSDTINVFLDIAVDNGLITKEQRESITDYELLRGDRTTYRSILLKGIANDMYIDTTNTSSNQTTLFRNFPYNTLGDNAFLWQDESRKKLISHPFDSKGNNRFSVISPEIYTTRPGNPTEVGIEGYMYGNSIGGFQSVKDHAEWVILGKRAHNLAGLLATAEVVFESALNIATLLVESSHNYEWGLWGGWTFGTIQNIAGTIASTAATAVFSAIQIANAALFQQPKYKTQWLQSFEDLGNTHNFADMFISEKGWLNSFNPNKDVGNMLRGVVTSKYLKPGRPTFTEGAHNNSKPIQVNNVDREDSLYISFGDTYNIEYPNKYSSYDNYSNSPRNSSRYLASEIGCNYQMNNIRRIANPYFSLKNYIPDQYGKIDSIKWLSINHKTSLKDSNPCNPIFGGDTVISRVDLKNKFPFFYVTAMKIGNRVPFDYKRYSNIGVSRFYCSYKTSEDNVGITSMPFLSTEFNFDCHSNDRVFYERPPSKMYLYSYGIPYFLIESDINANFRYAGTEPHEQFASNGVNVNDWVQETNVSIAFNNIFYYNSIYSRNQTGLSYRTLPSVYDKTTWDCLSEAENGIAWSQQDNSEISLADPWLVFKPYDIYRFEKSFGNLITMQPIESQQVLGLFTNNAVIFNAVDVLKDRVNTVTEELGTGGIFAQRPIQFSYTELGETGSQHRAFVSCEMGHFWVDARRGKVFQLHPNAQGLTTISDFRNGGGESGMRRWFKKHLPFKILKQNIEGLTEKDIDNPYKGLGINMWWDSRFKRVFITKLDYTVKPFYKGKIKFKDGDFTYNDNIIEVTNTEYFKNISWTVAYSPIYNSWISYYDFFPQYSISQNDYFQTGLNYSNDSSEEGLWSHLLTNKSFQVFYGKKYPWIIEIPIKNNYVNNILNDLKIWSISQRYINESDFAVWRNKGFNEIIIYNQTNNSGKLEIDYDDTAKSINYPKSVNSYTQKILGKHFDNKIYLNYFYNRVRREESHLPIWNWDDNEIHKILNPDSISFNSKKVLERLRGDWFLVRLTYDKDSRFKQYFKWTMISEQPY